VAKNVCYEEFPTWLVVERADGRIEDKGFVRCERLMPISEISVDTGTPAPPPEAERHSIRFSTEDRSFGLCVTLNPEDYVEGTDEILAPLHCTYPDGRVDRLWIGAAAWRFMRERQLLLSPSPPIG
jgi:hypothetical protein